MMLICEKSEDLSTELTCFSLGQTDLMRVFQEKQEPAVHLADICLHGNLSRALTWTLKGFQIMHWKGDLKSQDCQGNLRAWFS